jgi:hypothetical protein
LQQLQLFKKSTDIKDPISKENLKLI